MAKNWNRLSVARKLSSQRCELCQQVRDLTFHHLIPRKLHRRNSFRKRFDKDSLSQGIYICRICHNGLHKTYDELSLAKRFSSKSAILSDEKLSKHIEWSAKQKRCPSNTRKRDENG